MFKIGDEVFLIYKGWDEYQDSYQLTTVKSISPKRGDISINGYDTVFNKNGDSKDHKSLYNIRCYIVLATPELKDTVNLLKIKQQAIVRIRNTNFTDLSAEKLQKIVAILDEKSDTE